MMPNRFIINRLGFTAAIGCSALNQLQAQEAPPPPVIPVQPITPPASEPLLPLADPTNPVADPYLLNSNPILSPQDPYTLDYSNPPAAENDAPIEDQQPVPLPKLSAGFLKDTLADPASLIASESTLGALMAGLHYRATMTGTYDSNVKEGNRGQADSQKSEGDYILSLGGNIGYRSRGTRWYIGGSLGGSYEQYYNRSELSGFNGHWNANAGFTGEKFKANFAFSTQREQGMNRVYAGFAEQTSYTSDLALSYKLTGKTSINANVVYIVTSNGQDFGDTTKLSADLNAMWKLGYKTSIGPGVNYTAQTGDIHPDRTSIGPTFSASYQISDKVNINSRIGLDYTKIDGEKSYRDPSISGALGASYRPSELWGMNLSFVRGVSADPTASGSYNETNSLTLAYDHRILRYLFILSATYEKRDSEQTVTSTGPGNSGDFFSLAASLSTMIFADTTQARIFASYDAQTSDDRNEELSGYRLGFSLSRSF